MIKAVDYSIFTNKGNLFEKQFPKLRQYLIDNWRSFKRLEAVKLIQEKAPKVYKYLLKNCYNKQSCIRDEYLWKLLHYNKETVCKVCGTPTNFQLGTKTFGEYCSKECVNKDPDLWIKRRQTCKERFGEENVFASDYGKQKVQEHWQKLGAKGPTSLEEIKDKRRQTCKENWGEDHPMKTEKGKQLLADSMLEKHGVTNAMFLESSKEKIRETNLKNRGVEWAFQDEEVKQKIANTNKERFGEENVFASDYGKQKIKEYWQTNFGVDHGSQVPEIREKMAKNSFKRKEVTILGKTLITQGFEPVVLKDLETKGLLLNLTNSSKHIPGIQYTYKNKTHVYHADCLLKLFNGQKILLEVKSSYTLSLKGQLSQNKVKFREANKYCKRKGWIFLLAIPTKPSFKVLNSVILYFKYPKNIKAINDICILLEKNNIRVP